MVFYADDTNVLFRGTAKNDIVTITNAHFLKQSIWLKTNWLLLNIQKAKFTIFRTVNKRDQEPLAFNFYHRVIKQVKEPTFLGVWFHEKFS